MPKPVRIQGYGTFDFPDTMSDDEIREYVENELRRKHQEKITYGAVPDALMGAARGISNIGEGVAWGAETLGAKGLGSLIREGASANRERLFGWGPEMPGSTAAQWGETAGTTLGLVPVQGLAWHPLTAPVARPLAGILGAGMGGEEQRKRQLEAIAQGEVISPEERLATQLGGAATSGLWEALVPGLGGLAGRGLGKAIIKESTQDAVKRLAGLTLGGIGREAGKSFVKEAGQEVGEEATQNWLEQFYNPKRELTEGLLEAGIAGGLMGGAFGAGAAGLGRHIARGHMPLVRELEQRREAQRILEEAGANLTDPTSTIDDISGVEKPDPSRLFHMPPAGTAAAEKPEEFLRRSAEAAGVQQQPGDVTTQLSALEEQRKKEEEEREAARVAAAAAEPVAPAPEPEDPLFGYMQKFLSERLGKYKLDQAFGLNLLRDLRTGAGDQAEGRYVPGSRKLEILYQARGQNESMEDWQERIGGILDHEIVHGLKEARIFTPEQWHTLLRRARKSGKLALAQQHYAGMPGYGQEQFEEEGVAYVLQDSAGRRAPDGFMRRMWERISGTFDRVGNAYRGFGWQTADEVMGDLRGGRIGQWVQDVDAREAARRAGQQPGVAPVVAEEAAAAPVPEPLPRPDVTIRGEEAPLPQAQNPYQLYDDAEKLARSRNWVISAEDFMQEFGIDRGQAQSLISGLKGIYPLRHPDPDTEYLFSDPITERKKREAALRRPHMPPYRGPVDLGGRPVVPDEGPVEIPDPREALLERVMRQPVHADPDDPRTLAAVDARLRQIAAAPGETPPELFRHLIDLRRKLASPKQITLTNAEWQTLDDIAPRIRPTPGRPAPLPVAPPEPVVEAAPEPLPAPAPPPLAPPPPPPKPKPRTKAREKAAEVRAELDQIAKELAPAPDAATVKFEEDLARIREAKAAKAAEAAAAKEAEREAVRLRKTAQGAKKAQGLAKKQEAFQEAQAAILAKQQAEIDAATQAAAAAPKPIAPPLKQPPPPLPVAAAPKTPEPALSASAAFKKAIVDMGKASDSLAFLESNRGKAGVDQDKLEADIAAASRQVERVRAEYESAAKQVEAQQAAENPRAKPKSKLHEVMGQAPPPAATPTQLPAKPAPATTAEMTDADRSAVLEMMRSRLPGLQKEVDYASKQLARAREPGGGTPASIQEAEYQVRKWAANLKDVEEHISDLEEKFAAESAAQKAAAPQAAAPPKQRFMVNRWWQSETGPEGRAPDGYKVVDTETGKEVGPYASKQVAEKQAQRMAKVAGAQGPQPLYAVFRGRNTERLPTAATDPDTITHPSEIATRHVTALPKKGVVLEDRMSPEVITSYESASRDPAKFLKNILAAKQALNFRDITEEEVMADPHAAAQKMIGRMRENLNWLHDKMQPELRQRARLWYDGANRIAKHFGKQFGLNNDQAAGVLAVFSPQKDWFQNVDMARRAMDFYKKRNRAKWDKRMDEAFLVKRDSKKLTMGQRLPDTVPLFAAIQGKRFTEITDPAQQALWFRLHDEATNPRPYPVVTPEGEFGKWALNDDQKTKSSVAWSGFGPIMKAFSIMQDGSHENISNSLGDEHKVRNFYMNILVPNSPRGHVTMDTHAVAAALVRALSGEDLEVLRNFGGAKGTSGSKYTGEAGTYFLNAEAYRLAAKDQGLLPREMQSITWEAIRGLFNEKFKGYKTIKGYETVKGKRKPIYQFPDVEAIDRIWENNLQGLVSRKQARELAYERGGGIDTPDWATDRGRVRGQDVEGEHPADAEAVLQRGGNRGEPGRVAAPGTGSQSPVALPAPGLPVGRGQREGNLPAGDVAPRYALPRPRPNSLASQIIGSAEAIRAGTPVNIQNPADRIMAERLASNPNVDLEKLYEDRPDLNFDKLEMDDRDKEHLRLNVGLARQALGPHIPFTFDRLKAITNKLIGSSDFLETDIQKLKERGTLDPAVRLAYNTMLKETQAEVIKRTIELNNGASGMTKDQRLQAQAAIDVLERKIHQFTNVLVPARTQDGRNLAFHRITAERTFSRPFWEARVKRMMSLPPNVDLPEDVAIPLNKAITGGQAAEQQQQDAQKEFDANPTPANAAKKKKADEDLLKARRVFSGQVQQFNKTNRPEAILALWKAGLLTNPASRFADAGSNAAFAALEKLASVPADWIDTALSKSKIGSGRRTVLSQLRSESLAASGAGFSTGLAAAKKQLGDALTGKAETSQTTLNRFDLRKQFDIDLGSSAAGKATAKGLKKYVEGVYGVQQATDQPFRQAAYQMGLEEHARLQAVNEAREGRIPASGVDARTKELIANPTDALKAEAEFMENFMSFAEDNWGAKGFNAFKAAAAKMPGGSAVGHIMDVVMPFVKIPTNVFRRVLEYSPYGAVKGGAGIAAAQIANKALDPKQQRLYSQLLARGSVGSALMLLGWSAASKGLMSGIRDREDQEGKAADEAAGRPPGSIKVGDKWVQIGRISPFGNMLITGASLFQQGESATPKDRLGKMAGTMTRTVLDMPFLMGAETLLDALENPAQKGGAYLSRQIGSVVPAGVKRIAATVDPVQRDLKDEGLFSDLLVGLPGVSRQFEARRDPLGRPVPQAGLGPLGPLFDPLRTVTGYDDPASKAIGEYQVKMAKPKKQEGESNATYGLRAELAGLLYQQGILEALQSPEFAAATTKEEKHEAVQDGREAGGKLLSDMTTRNEEWKQSTDAQRRMMLDTYLDQVRAMAGR